MTRSPGAGLTRTGALGPQSRRSWTSCSPEPTGTARRWPSRTAPARFLSMKPWYPEAVDVMACLALDDDAGLHFIPVMARTEAGHHNPLHVNHRRVRDHARRRLPRRDRRL